MPPTNRRPVSGGNVLEQTEREQIVRALSESNRLVGGARGATARLGLKRPSLAYKMQKLGDLSPTAVTEIWQARKIPVF